MTVPLYAWSSEKELCETAGGLVKADISYAVSDEEDHCALIEGVDDVHPERVRAIELALAARRVELRL